MTWVAKLSEACGLFSAFAIENHPLQTAIRIPNSQAIQRARHAELPPPIDPLNARRRPRRNAVVACDEGPGERGVKGGGRGVTDVGQYQSISTQQRDLLGRRMAAGVPSKNQVLAHPLGPLAS